MITYTFIIPHHNTPDLLNRCIDSIPVRDDIQIIVIDDNSNQDKRPAILREGVETLYINRSETKGAGKARNEGLKYAHGKWLLFADCDDYYCNGFVDTLDKYKDQDIEVLYFNFEQIDGNMGITPKPLYFRSYFDEYNGTKESLDNLRFHHNVPWTKMVRKDFVDKYKIEFEEAINGNDIFFSMTAGYLAKKIAVEKTPLYTYLINSNSITTKKATIDSTLCKFIHNVKINEFYKLVGHQEWVKPFNVYFANALRSLVWSKRIPFIIKLTICTFGIIQSRNEWVNKLNSVTKCH